MAQRQSPGPKWWRDRKTKEKLEACLNAQVKALAPLLRNVMADGNSQSWYSQLHWARLEGTVKTGYRLFSSDVTPVTATPAELNALAGAGFALVPTLYGGSGISSAGTVSLAAKYLLQFGNGASGTEKRDAQTLLSQTRMVGGSVDWTPVVDMWGEEHKARIESVSQGLMKAGLPWAALSEMRLAVDLEAKAVDCLIGGSGEVDWRPGETMPEDYSAYAPGISYHWWVR